jgi:formylglycine-generating enzyme required for sulfatase activity
LILENRYRIVSLIKKGGMGAVYRAEDTRLDTVCAVKELMIDADIKPEDSAKYAGWFIREAKLLAMLDHPNLPKVFDFFTSGEKYYLAMTFIEGEDLLARLERDGRPGLLVPTVLDWAGQILKVLDYLHSMSPPVIYRDLKPQNIMLHRDGRIMLVDFGIAKKLLNESGAGRTVIGTMGYAPAEQWIGRAEPRSDIYSLGATLFHLLAGRYFETGVKSMRSVNPEISAELESILNKAMSDSPDDRYSSAAEMLKAIESLSGAGRPRQIAVPPVQAAAALPQAAVPAAPPGSAGMGDAVKRASADITLKGSEMVLIPAGEFLMGSADGQGEEAERPQHRVYLDAFHISAHPVTNEQYERFMVETNYQADSWWAMDLEDDKGKHPVVHVSWNDAMAYCRWAGGTLPTEARWEKAARGVDGRIYPWGNEWDGSRCNWAGRPNGPGHPCGDCERGTTPVGSFPAGISPYGLYDMIGNVWEWCLDRYGFEYYRHSPPKNPEGPGRGKERSLRGGAWVNDDTKFLRCASRAFSSQDSSDAFCGFRICLKADAGPFALSDT